MASGDTKTEAMLNALGNGGSADEFRGCCNTKTQQYILDAIDRVQNVEDEVEELKNNPDVVDIVDTYADLQAYDTTHLSNNDIIRVLADETHSGNSTYYKFNKQAGTWTFIGEISGGSITPVQTPGASQTDVMSQNATTSMVFSDPSTQRHIKMGSGSSLSLPTNGAVTIGRNSKSRGDTVSIGYGAGSTDPSRSYNVNIGASTNCGSEYSVALGHSAKTTRNGEVNIGSGTAPYGYNNTSYRVLGGVHDPVDAHDAATKGYVDANAGGSAVFYMSSTLFPSQQAEGVSLYSDAGLTTAVPASTFVQALRNCKSVFLMHKSGSQDADYRETAQIVYSSVPNADTSGAYDETFPTAAYFDSNGFCYKIQSGTSDPTDTASFAIWK